MDIPSEQTFWAPPPPGMTKTLARCGPDIFETFTYRCDQDSECFALAYSKNPDEAKRAIDRHICPAPPRRDMVPTGKTVIQKLWDELDELTDSVNKFEDEPETRETQGMAVGVALALALLSVPWFRSKEDILLQANKRWRMRQQEIPWEMTPGYNYYPAAPLAFAQSEPASVKKRQPVSKAVKTTKAAIIPTREFSIDERTMIRGAVHGGTISVADLAKMYDVSEERIASIAGSKPDPSVPSMPAITLF